MARKLGGIHPRYERCGKGVDFNLVGCSGSFIENINVEGWACAWGNDWSDGNTKSIQEYIVPIL